jgi:DNA-binding winged helix-turn-helix (wHTH) protein
MDTQSKQQLERLYGLALSATATTHFYNEVYKYVAYIKQSPTLVHILEEDEKEMQIKDREKYDTAPKLQDGESEFYNFVKRMRHMSSGEHFFVSHLFFLLTHHIYDLLDWHYTENYQSKEVTVMLHGKIKVSYLERCLRHLKRDIIVGFDNTDYNKRYIDDFPVWKNILTKFHTILIEKIENSPEYKIAKVFNLKASGTFTYLTKSGNFDTTSEEYKIVRMLYDKNGGTVLYEDIFKDVYQKEISKIGKMTVNNHIRKIKEKLGILPVTSASLQDIIINHKGVGYSLDIQTH